MVINKVNESTIKITDIEFDTAKFLSEEFSFYAENYRFNPKYKMKKWDGKIRLYNLYNSTLPMGGLHKLINLCENTNIDYTLKGFDNLKIKVTLDEIEHFLKNEMLSDLQLRDYQFAALATSLELNKCVTILPTASGKSFYQYTLINYLLKRKYCEKVLLIVPSISLVNQMEFDFLDYASNLTNYEEQLHKVFGGQEKDTNKPITISTWQSLKDMGEDWYQQFDCVLVDECHTTKGAILTKIISLCTNSKIRIGCTGTLSESQVDVTQLEILFGKIVQYTTTKELIDNGTLTPIKIYNLVLNYGEAIKKSYKKTISAMKKADVANSIDQSNAAKYYNYENDYIKDNKLRKKFILSTLKKCKGNSLVLFKNVEYGETLCELATKYLDRNVYLVHGKITPKERERIRLIMEDEEDAIIFATLSIFSTGINIKKLKYLIFSQNIKSKFKVIQSIGRVLRKHKTKDEAIIIDIIDNITGKNYSMKHALAKLEMYNKEGYQYKVKEIDL